MAGDPNQPQGYRLTITSYAERQLKKLPLVVASRLVPEIRSLAENPRPPGCKKLQGRVGYRIRVGMYRIVYLIDDEVRVVSIEAVGHRRDVYD